MSAAADVLLIAGTFRVPVDRVEAARISMATMVVTSRVEPGCVAYAYAVDLLEPGLIHVSECWIDRGALDRHFASAHLAVWRAAWPALGITDRRLSLYEVDEPLPT